MMPKGIAFAIVFLVISFISFAAFALSYPPAPLYHRIEKSETVMTQGDAVSLFHSGTSEIRNSVRGDDILTVYRISSSCEIRETGKIRIMSQIGETYLTGIVIDGEIRPNDIAKKGSISFLVISTGACRR